MKKKLSLIIVFTLLMITSRVSYSQNDIDNRKLRMAETYENAGDYDDAARLYKEVLDNSPGNEIAFQGYARSYIAQNKYSEIIPTAEEFVKIKPKPYSLALLGELYWRTGQPEKANKQWKELIDKYPDNSETYAMMSDMYSDLQLFDKAVEVLEKARDKFDKEQLFADRMSKLFIALGNAERGTEEIINLLKETSNSALAQGRLYALMADDSNMDYIHNKLNEIAAEQADDYFIQRLYAWFLTTINDYDQALEAYKKIDYLTQSQGKELIQFASTAMNDGNFSAALKAYEAVMEMGDDNKYLPSALYGFARALESKHIQQEKFNVEEINAIISRYKRITKEFPNSPTSAECTYRIAELYLDKLNNRDKAIDWLDKLIDNKSFRQLEITAKGLNILGKIQIIEKNNEEALQIFSNVRSYFKQYPAQTDLAEYNIALVKYFEGKLDTARAFFDALSFKTRSDLSNDALNKLVLIDLYQDHQAPLHNFIDAEYLEYRNKPREALDKYMEVIRQAEGTGLDNMAMLKAASLEYKRDNFTGAIEILTDFLDNNPETFIKDEAYYKLGLSYYQINDNDKAEETFKSLLATFPNSIYLHQAREKIREIRNKGI
ncbi:MAG: tetratricopeptide repeat protein [Candidatus Kapaibacterium sp.]